MIFENSKVNRFAQENCTMLEQDLSNLLKIYDQILWVSYQEKDKSTNIENYGAIGCGYGNKQSYMCLFAEIYRSFFKEKLFDTILFQDKIHKPCVVSILDSSSQLSSNCIVAEPNKDNKVFIEFKKSDVPCKFWRKLLTNGSENLLLDVKHLMETALGIVINYDIPDSEKYKTAFKCIADEIKSEDKDQLKEVIQKMIQQALQKIKVDEYSFLSEEEEKTKQLIVGSLFYPWDILIYDDFSSILGNNNVIEGGVTISYNSPNKDEQNQLNDFIPKCQNVLNEIKLVALKKIWQDNLEYRKNLAIKSSKAAIMSRNMSHNLGSHVMFYIKQKLNSVEKIKRSEVLHELYKDGRLAKEETLTTLEMPFMVGMGRFINYLQERQDYIATIATDYVPSSSIINFKDFIYDELKPELRYSRHKKKDPNSVEIKGTEPKNLLMDYIALSEGYESSESIHITFGKFNGYDPQNQPNKYTNKDREQAKKDFQRLRDFHIAIPSGVIGRQAFFSIIENIIRNAAKHSDPSDSLRLAIDLIEGEDKSSTKKLIEEELKKGYKFKDTTGDIDGPKLIDRYVNYSKDFMYLCITNQMANHGNHFDTILKGIADEYVDDSGSMKDQYKGIKEIRISAAWMRGYWIDTVIPAEEPPVVSVCETAIDENDKNAGFNIKYLFALRRPKSVAILVDKETEIDKDFNHRFEYNGCTCFSYDDVDKKNLLSDIAQYDLVISSIDQNKFKEKVAPFVNARYATIGKADLKTLLAKNGINEMEGMAYRLWFESLGRKSELIIADEKAVNAGKKHHLVKTSDSEDEKILTPGAAVYVKHFTNMSDDPQKSEKFKECCFIEGVTGNNSTDRLIRQDEWTDKWMYKHLAAAVTRVAIFDERIFSYVNGKEQITPEEKKNIINKYSASLKQFNQEHPNLPKDANKVQIELLKFIEKEFTDEEINGFETVIREKNTAGAGDDIFSLLKNIPIFASQWFKHTSFKKSNDNGEIKIAQHYRETNVWVYNIEKVITKEASNEETTTKEPIKEKTMSIVGYSSPVSDKLGTLSSGYMIRTVGELKMTTRNGQKDFSVTFFDSKTSSDPNDSKTSSAAPNEEKFDFISIHQGILDKIYTEFGVKGDDDMDMINRCKITWILHKCLSTKAEMTTKTWNCTKKEECSALFLPQFIIHSGRSKPNSADMPQHQPFTQFAAIDHAVRDCKYTLSELLYTMHYEPSK